MAFLSLKLGVKPPHGPIGSLASSKPIEEGVVSLKCALATDSSAKVAQATDLIDGIVGDLYVLPAVSGWLVEGSRREVSHMELTGILVQELGTLCLSSGPKSNSRY